MTSPARRYPRRVVVALATLAVLGSSVVATAPASAAAPAAAASSAITLKVMSQNIFYGGDDLDPYTETFCPVADGCPENLLRIEAVIRKSGADVVGLQEAERNTDVIAKALGWYGSARDHVISRFPIVDPPDGDGVYVFVEPSPGRVVAVANVHMPSDPYGPFAVRDGATKAQLLELERTVRMPAIQPQLKVLPALAARGIPVFLTGDFNSPSALDWTAAVAAVRPDVQYPVKWPVSQALLDAGMRDSYREVHPDPVATPGFTWTPGSPEADPHEVFDRIDWVMHAGPSTALDSTVVGEVGDPDAGVQVSRTRATTVASCRRSRCDPPCRPSSSRCRRGGCRPARRSASPSTSRPAVPVRSRWCRPAAAPARPCCPGPPVATATEPSGSAVRSPPACGPAPTTRCSSAGRVEVLSRTPLWVYPPGTHASISTDRSIVPGRPAHRGLAGTTRREWPWTGSASSAATRPGAPATVGTSCTGTRSTAIRGSGVIGPGPDTFPARSHGPCRRGRTWCGC